MITIYVIQSSENGKRYVGITENLDRRLMEHRSRSSKAGQLLGTFTILHTETAPDYTVAREREKYLKSGSGREWLLKQYPRSSGPPSGG
jgi:putative endonuclease